ncbi:MAG: ABC transporter permease [Legionellales bacterium]|nr:ABC transporter permease [Legionellales bacterium]
MKNKKVEVHLRGVNCYDSFYTHRILKCGGYSVLTLSYILNFMKKSAVFYDIADSIFRYQIWFLLGWQDIKLRYRRSTIGPFWLTLSMAVTIYSMGFLYAKLFHVKLVDYYPYLTVGMISWQFISSIVNESTQGFLQAESFLKEMKLPAPVFIMRMIFRNFLILLHNLPVYIPIIFIFHIKLNLYFLLFIPALLLIILNGFVYGTLLAFLGARFRDVGQIVASLIQVIFFITPIMWSTSALTPQDAALVQKNPFAIFIELLRAPLLGTTAPVSDYLFACISGIIGLILLMLLYPRYKSRLIYWL